MLTMYYPFSNESELFNELPTNLVWGIQPKILDTIHNNMALVQPFAEIIDESLDKSEYRSNDNNDPFSQQENNAVMVE